MTEKKENLQDGRLTKEETKTIVFGKMVQGATLIAIVNNWHGIAGHKSAFMDDPNIKDKSPLAFAKWMVDNVSYKTSFNIIHGIIHYKVLPPFGDTNTTIVEKDYINF